MSILTLPEPVAPDTPAYWVIHHKDRLWYDLQENRLPGPVSWQEMVTEWGLNAASLKPLQFAIWNGKPCCQIHLPELQATTLSSSLFPVRQLLPLLDQENFQLLSRGFQFSWWQENHRFCGRCGHPTRLNDRETALVCTACGFRAFPRISPCVIMLVRQGERALLAQGVNHPEGAFSTLAGFVEAGETAEQAVIREVKEEVGIQVKHPRYITSQSWPFPHSLMLAFTVEYQEGEISPEPDEIIQASWFERHQLPERLPPKGSVARALIDRWLQEAE